VSELASGGGAGPDAETVYDELVTGTGRVRPHWQTLMSQLSPLEPAALEERRDEAVQLLRQHGVTYAVYGDPHGVERPWPLDLLPLVIAEQEWRAIEAGAIQRVRLLNEILADIYGKQRLVADGLIPPSLLHANPRFLHPCWNVQPGGGAFLHLSALDLCRAPDGRWQILSDRTQAPSGAGYALENRSVIGRVLADCIGASPVQPLAPFFAGFRDSLHALSAGGGRARVVLLTPGPYNDTYFEHVYLARHLGVTLVEGNDLTVRDRQVFLKTLSGLERIGVILRRLDDDFCDPIELRASSALGIAGLVEAARAGTVVIANALGSGVLEATAFKPLLARLARPVLGEDLLLQDLPTWWCGAASDRAHVLARLDEMVIKPAFGSAGLNPIFGDTLTRADREALRENILLRPFSFVGQQRAYLSTAPVWGGERLEPRGIILRVFVAATRDGYAVMPGGLTRTAPRDGSIIAMQLGSGSKDSWVMAPDAETMPIPLHAGPVSPLPQPAFARPAGGELPSRVADGLFWLGRYAERADCVVRLLRTLLSGVTDAIQPWRFRDAEPVLNLAAWLELVPVIDHPDSFQPISLVQAALLDPAHSHGVIASVQRLLTTARGVRDHLPPECWRILMAFDRHIAEPVGRAPPVRLLLRLEDLMTLGAALAGATAEAMPRDAGWRFLEIGRRLERAISLVTMLRGLTQPPLAESGSSTPVAERRLLAAILALTESRGVPEIAASDRPETPFDRERLLRSILMAESDPRSLAFQLSALSEHLASLPQPSGSRLSGGGSISSALHLVEAARKAMPEAIANAHPGAKGTIVDGDRMRAAFAPLDRLLPQISDLLTQAYFTHALTRSA